MPRWWSAGSGALVCAAVTRVFADDKAIRSASSDLVRELHESIRRLPQLPMAARWVAGSGEGQVHRAAVLDGSSVIMNFGSFEGLRSWRAFEDAWRSDSVLRDSEKQTAGFWNPQTVLHWALPKSIALRRSKAVLDEAHGLLEGNADARSYLRAVQCEHRGWRGEHREEFDGLARVGLRSRKAREARVLRDLDGATRQPEP